MKDIPHHMKKLNRKVIKSPEEIKVSNEEMQEAFSIPKSDKQKKKQGKLARKKQRELSHPHFESIDEQNKDMNKRIPIIREREHKPFSI